MDDLIKIKNKYGEEMMHFARKSFSSILETPGLLFNLFEKNFAYSKILYSDIIENNYKESFIAYIYSLLDVKIEKAHSKKTPKELLSEAGYDLYECKSEEDIQSFRKYYAKDEELCTFKEGNRLDSCYVFFAVKKNVDEIKREDFKFPSREDLYGTSVISIQFSRGKYNVLSIKNRYNDKIYNPDATFSNNLENINKGLTYAFENTYNLKIVYNEDVNFKLPNYVKAADGKMYKYNYNINGIYYCIDNIIIDGNKIVTDYQKEKERYLIFDYFILDLHEKKLKLYDNTLIDSFINDFDGMNKISIVRDGDKKTITIDDNILIILDKDNRMIYYENKKIKNINDLYLYENIYLKGISLNEVENVGLFFLNSNMTLKDLNLPKLKSKGDFFLCNNPLGKNIVVNDEREKIC